jgi:transposase, IS5 family
MTQENFDFDPLPKKTRREVLLEEMNAVVPWAALVALIQPHARGAHQALGGRPPFAGLAGARRLPDETTILRFRHLLDKHQLAPKVLATINAQLAQRGLKLKTGTLVDATLIAAPSSTKNSTGERDPEMHQTKKGNQWHFGMKAHIGVDADTGLVHSVVGTAANVNDVTQAHKLLHGAETDVYADAGYQGVGKREEVQELDVNWHVAMRPGKRRVLDKNHPMGRVLDEIERLKASVRARVEHPFRVIKQQFGYAKVRYRGLAKNTSRLTMLFAMSNLWMSRRTLLQGTGA